MISRPRSDRTIAQDGLSSEPILTLAKSELEPPKRPLHAYHLFMRERFGRVETRVVVKQCSELWTAMSAHEKKVSLLSAPAQGKNVITNRSSISMLD